MTFSKDETRNFLIYMLGSGNTSDKIQHGCVMSAWFDPTGDIDGRRVHRWVMEYLNPGDSFKTRDGSLSLDYINNEVIGHFDSGKGIWVFTYGRIQFFRKPRAFAEVTWKDLTRGNIGNNLTRGLQEHEGTDYLAVFQATDSEIQWCPIQGPIQTDLMPLHLPMALRFLQNKITRWIRSYDSSMLRTVLERQDEYYGEKLGDINWLGTIYEQSMRSDSTARSVFSHSPLMSHFGAESRGVPAAFGIWQEFLKVTNRGDLETDLVNEAMYENVVEQFKHLVYLGRQLLNVRKSSDRRAVPILTPSNSHHFALWETETKTVLLELPKQSDHKLAVITAPLAAGKTHDLIGISMSDEALTYGIHDHTDDLSPKLSIRQLYYQSLKDAQDVIKIKIPRKPFERAVEGNYRDIVLEFRSSERVNNELVQLHVHGMASLEMGTVQVQGTPIEIAGVRYDLVGYDLDFERINSRNK